MWPDPYYPLSIILPHDTINNKLREFWSHYLSRLFPPSSS